MVEMIDSAQSAVDLEQYIFRADEVGQRVADALTTAAARGVTCRVLVDWIGIRGTPWSFFRRLRTAGITVRVFNPFGWRRWLGVVPRDHRKLLAVDGARGVTGGIGIGKEWRTGVLKRRRSPWRDTAVCIEGPAGADMTRAFEHMWKRAAPRRVDAAQAPLDWSVGQISAAPSSYGTERRGSARLMTRKARGTHLDPTTDEPALVGLIEGEPGRLRVSRALQIQSVSAEKSIWIASAYFVPSFSEVEALTGAARDGVDVRLLVPSRYDHPWVRLMTVHFYRRLLMNGVRIWEWAGEMMHAKTSVVDSRYTRVGSTDLNPLGLAINFELDAVIEDAAFGEQAEQMFLSDLDQ